MPNSEKINEVGILSERIADNSVFFITDYRGMTVKKFEELRRNLRASGFKVRVAKNRLFRKAWVEDEKTEKVFSFLKDPTAVIFAQGDPSTSAKILQEFLKDSPLPKVKAIVINDDLYLPDSLDEFASLPSVQQLHSMVVSTLAAPLTGFVRVLNGLPQKLVYALNAIAEKDTN
jgi:large subunit ribosomal protein L10